MPNVDHLLIGIDASRAVTREPTGTERYSQRIIEALLEEGRQHDFRLYLNSHTPLPLPVRASTVQRTIPWPRLWTHLRLAGELLRHRVDALFVPAHVVPPVHPPATVVTIHDLGYRYEPSAHRRVSRRYLDLSTRWSCRRARRVIAISEATRRDLVRFYRVPPAKISVVHHGVDTIFQPATNEAVAAARRKYGLPSSFLLYVGTLQPRKNLERLVAAFELLADTDPALGLVLAGKVGWLADALMRRVESSRHRGRIVMPGRVPDDDLPALYSGASVFVLPSLYEGFGMPALEAMACGTPVVVSNRGAPPEVAGEAAIVVEPDSVSDIADGLRAALDPARARQLARLGSARARQFDWATSGKKTLAVIEAAFVEAQAR